MKTLKELAATFNLYQENDIPQQWKKDIETFNWRMGLNNRDNKVPDFFNGQTDYEVGIFHECKVQDKGTPKEIFFIEHGYILIKKNDSDLVLMLKKDRNNKYTLFPYYDLLWEYHKVNQYIRQDALKGLIEPNIIGVFTLNKLNAWYDYCIEYMRRMETTLQDVTDKNAEIEKKIQDFIDSVPGAEVTKYDKRITVKTDMFQVRFEHFKDQKYLRTDIEFQGNLEDVIKLSKVDLKETV